MSDINGIAAPTAPMELGEVDSEYFKEIFSRINQNLFNDSALRAGPDEEFVAQIGKGSQTEITLQAPAALSSEDLAFILGVLQQSNMEEMLKYSGESIKVDQQQMKALQAERLQQLQEFLEKSRDANKHGSIGKVFGWIAAGAMAVIGAALIATGVGAALGAIVITSSVSLITSGALLMAASAAVLLPMISAETGNWLTEGVSQIFEFLGVDNAELAAEIAIMVATTIIVVACTFGAASCLKVAELPATIGRIMNAVNMANSSMAVAQTGISMKAAVSTYQAKMAEADAVETMAFVAYLQMLMQDQMDRVSELTEKIEENMTMVIAILNSAYEVKGVINRNISV